MYDLLKSHPEQASAIAAVCAVFTSLLSIVLALASLLIQRSHNRKSVTPIASLPISDYEDRLAIALHNSGIGPLVVQRLRVSDGTLEKDDIISWMPDLPSGIFWTTFYDSLDGLALRPAGTAVILELSGIGTGERACVVRDEVRRALSRLTLTVEYSDIYGRTMKGKTRSLDWFGRHFNHKEAATPSF